MWTFDNLNPAAVLLFTLYSVLVPIVSFNPVFLFIFLAGAVSLFIIVKPRRGRYFHVMCVVLCAASSAINALFVHRGNTVLLVINDRPVTLEALVYGFFCGVMLVSSLYYFAFFTEVMTSDRLMYLFSFLSSDMALTLSMALRFVPRFLTKAKEIRNTQKAMGNGGGDDFIRKFRSEASVFSALLTWALENGVVTAQSMESRGYGLKKRTYYKRFVMDRQDIFIICVQSLCFAVCVFSLFAGNSSFGYYPAVSAPELSPLSFTAYASYAVCVFMPVILFLGEEIKWKYLLRKI